jgi:acetyl-CoA C-acetyltransferase
MDKTVTVTGTGMTKFGELWDSSPRALAREATAAALGDAGIEAGDVDALFVGNMLAGLLGNQQHAGALFAEELGISGAAMTVEGACASGGLAIHAAVQSLLAGSYRRVLVLGIEKMTDHRPEHVATALTAAGTSDERLAGITFPGLYAMLARAHMASYGTTERQMAAVAVKNHYHASLNPKAQFRTTLTVEQVMDSSYVADPLKLLDCSPITDGAAAIVLERQEGKIGTETVRIVASEVATDTLGVGRRKSLTELAATVAAAKRAYGRAGITPTDIDLAEVHDCFTIAEILALEDLGFAPKGEAARMVADGGMTLGSAGKIVVNTSGGLKGCGHPVGATGIKQIVELADQLRGRCGARQVKDARIGLAHNVGGSGATAVVHILRKGK